MLKKLLSFTLCMLFCTSPMVAFANETDVITSASVTYFYENSAMTLEEVLADLKLGAKKPGSTVVATVNEDGNPNLAVFVPGVADENTLVFSLMENQTRINFTERKSAVLSYYIYNPQAEDKLERNRGCRLVLQLVEDQARIDAYNQGKENVQYNQYFDIVEVLPLG